MLDWQPVQGVHYLLPNACWIDSIPTETLKKISCMEDKWKN